MMEIQLRLFLTTCMVFTFNQPHSQTIGQAVHSTLNDEPGTHENFQNLFESILKNNSRESDSYRKILKQDVARERQAFDDMKDELLITRHKNAEKVVNFSKRTNANSRDALMTKRQVNKYNFDPAKLDESYVSLYGNDPEICGMWVIARDMRMDTPRMKNLSSRVHYRMFYRKPLITNAFVAEKELHFDPRYNFKPMKIDVIAYTTDEEIVGGGEPRLHHFTKGVWPDCVYYLESRDAEAKSLSLLRQVCAIDLKLLYGF